MKRNFPKIAAIMASFALVLLPVFSVCAQDNAIIITPAVTVAAPGELFEVHIALDSNVTDVMVYVVHLKYDTSVVRFVDAWPDSAWYTLSSAGTQYFIDSMVVEEDSETGDSLWHLLIFDIIWSGIPKVTIDGYAEIATLQFEAVASGSTYLYFDTAIVKNPRDSIVVENTESGMLYVCPITTGNVNGDEGIDISDLVYLVDFMFTGGPPPTPSLLMADLNCSLTLDISDLVYMVDYMFTGGPEPCDFCP